MIVPYKTCLLTEIRLAIKRTIREHYNSSVEKK